MSESLFTQTSEAVQLINLAKFAETPEEEELFRDTLEAVLGSIDKKADDYCYVLSEIEGNADTVAKEINRLKVIEDRLLATRDRMKKALKDSMEATGRKEIQTDLHKIKIVNNGGLAPLVIPDETAVPGEYNKTEVKISPDKDKIRAALKNGEKLDFASLGERGTRLKID